MRYSCATLGRTFIIRLEDGEVVHHAIEAFARREGINAAVMVILGGADEGSRLVTGPQEGRTYPVNPLFSLLHHVHEVAGVGTLFPAEDGDPTLHLHMTCGHGNSTITGCARSGVRVWHVMEVVLIELLETTASRRVEDPPGFVLLQP